MEMLTSVDELYDNVKKTARVRFVAERRLSYHQRLSTWSISLASLALLLIPLSEAFNLKVHLAQKQLSVLEIVLAAFILVFSLLLGVENFGLQAERMKNCGTELTILARHLDGYRGAQIPVARYDDFVDHYGTILNRYGNHTYADFLISRLENQRKATPDFPRTRLLPGAISVFVRTALGFIHYIVFILTLAFIITRLF